MEQTKIRKAAGAWIWRRMRNPFCVVLAGLLIAGCGMWAKPIYGAQPAVKALFEGELLNGGEQLIVTVSLCDTTFNVAQFNLEYDETVLRLSTFAGNKEIDGTVKGSGLVRKGPLGEMADIVESSAFLSGSYAGEGEVKLLLTVDQDASGKGIERNEAGAKFYNAGSGTELVKISFRVKDGATGTALLEAVKSNVQVAGVSQERDGSGSGTGTGAGDGSGSGAGTGAGDGSGSGAGDGSGSGAGTGGSGDGTGAGDGSGSGAGTGGSGAGDGSGSGTGTGGSGDGTGSGTGTEGSGDGTGSGTGTGGSGDGTGSGEGTGSGSGTETGDGTGSGADQGETPVKSKFTKKTLRLASGSGGTGFVLAELNPKGGLIGYVDPGLVNIDIPGVGVVNQSDGGNYGDITLGGNGDSGSDGTGGSGSGNAGSGSIDIVDIPGIVDQIISGSGGTQGSGTDEEKDKEGQETAQGADGSNGAANPADAPKEPYYDIKGHWAEASLKALIEQQILSGYPDGSVKPGGTMTRAEFCVVLAKALGIAPAEQGNTYTDAANHWAKQYIGAISEVGITSGIGNGKFGPNSGITREELVSMIARTLKDTKAAKDAEESGGADEKDVIENEPEPSAFTDEEEIADWAKEAAVKARKEGLVNGYPDGSFQPKKEVTRAEMAVIVEKMLRTQGA